MRQPRPRPRGRAEPTRFALTVPGLAPIVERIAGGGVRVAGTGDDGRADVVAYTPPARGEDPVAASGLVEDVFAVIGRARRADGDDPAAIAGRLWDTGAVERALSTWAAAHGPLRRDMTFRVIVRVRQERSFRRTALRGQVAREISRARPRWRGADPAALELWVLEHTAGEFLAGLRLSDAAMRQHGGRAVERAGALRPVVAQAMVALAGDPGVLLDPCCGSGTILAAARGAGWEVLGRDIDPDAVEASRANVGDGGVRLGDARALDLGDAVVDACVGNLPFGRQYGVDGDMRAWLAGVLGELVRVTRPGGAVVVLAPSVPARAVPRGLREVERFRIRLLGTSTTIWRFRRDAPA